MDQRSTSTSHNSSQNVRQVAQVTNQATPQHAIDVYVPDPHGVMQKFTIQPQVAQFAMLVNKSRTEDDLSEVEHQAIKRTLAQLRQEVDEFERKFDYRRDATVGRQIRQENERKNSMSSTLRVMELQQGRSQVHPTAASINPSSSGPLPHTSTTSISNISINTMQGRQLQPQMQQMRMQNQEQQTTSANVPQSSSGAINPPQSFRGQNQQPIHPPHMVAHRVQPPPSSNNPANTGSYQDRSFRPQGPLIHTSNLPPINLQGQPLPGTVVRPLQASQLSQNTRVLNKTQTQPSWPSAHQWNMSGQANLPQSVQSGQTPAPSSISMSRPPGASNTSNLAPSTGPLVQGGPSQKQLPNNLAGPSNSNPRDSALVRNPGETVAISQSTNGAKNSETMVPLPVTPATSKKLERTQSLAKAIRQVLGKRKERESETPSSASKRSAPTFSKAGSSKRRSTSSDHRVSGQEADIHKDSQRSKPSTDTDSQKNAPINDSVTDKQALPAFVDDMFSINHFPQKSLVKPHITEKPKASNQDVLWNRPQSTRPSKLPPQPDGRSKEKSLGGEAISIPMFRDASEDDPLFLASSPSIGESETLDPSVKKQKRRGRQFVGVEVLRLRDAVSVHKNWNAKPHFERGKSKHPVITESEQFIRTEEKRLNPTRCHWKGCNAVLENHFNLKRHIKTSHVRPLQDTNIIECRCRWTLCRSKQRTSHLFNHIMNHISISLRCPYLGCDFAPRNVTSLKNHMSRNHHASEKLRPMAGLTNLYDSQELLPNLPATVPMMEAVALEIHGDPEASLATRTPSPKPLSRRPAFMVLSPTKTGKRRSGSKDNNEPIDQYSFMKPFYDLGLRLETLSNAPLDLFLRECNPPPLGP